jgi:hypothetical protein
MTRQVRRAALVQDTRHPACYTLRPVGGHVDRAGLRDAREPAGQPQGPADPAIAEVEAGRGRIDL